MVSDVAHSSRAHMTEVALPMPGYRSCFESSLWMGRELFGEARSSAALLPKAMEKLQVSYQAAHCLQSALRTDVVPHHRRCERRAFWKCQELWLATSSTICVIGP